MMRSCLLCCLAAATLGTGCAGTKPRQPRDGTPFVPIADFRGRRDQVTWDGPAPLRDLPRSEAPKGDARPVDAGPLDQPPAQLDLPCKQGWEDCSSSTCCSPLGCCTCSCGKFCRGNSTLSCNNTCINAC